MTCCQEVNPGASLALSLAGAFPPRPGTLTLTKSLLPVLTQTPVGRTARTAIRLQPDRNELTGAGCHRPTWPVAPTLEGPIVGDSDPSLVATYIHRLEAKTCFANAIEQNPEHPGVTWIRADVSGFDTFRGVSPLTTWNILAKKQRLADGAKILLDVAKESADWFPPLKSALGGVNALVKHYEVLVQCMTVVHN